MKKWIIIALAVILLGAAVAIVWVVGDMFYRQTRERLENPFKKLTLAVGVGEGKDRMTGSYNVRSLENGQTEIVYTFEEFALFEQKDGAYVIPSQRKSTVNGTVKLQEGEIVASNAKLPPLAVDVITLSGLSFRRTCFKNVTRTNSTFEADVRDPQKLIGLSEDCKDVHLSLSYDSEHVNALCLSYTTREGNRAELKFELAY